MIDPTMPPQCKYVVKDKNDVIKLVTSNKRIDSWYQYLFKIGKIKEIPMAKK